jgi:hypothetical protein
MNTYVNKKVSILAMEHPYEAHALRALVFLFVLLICAYLYFVAASILNIIAQKDAMAQTSQLEASLGDLETRYFSLSQSVTQQEGIAEGLQTMKPSYVYRPGNVGVVNEGSDQEI